MYKHTQIGWVMIISFIIMFFLFSFFIGPLAGQAEFVMGVAVFSLILLSLFVTLKIEVSNSFVKVIFGIGLIRFKFHVTDIASAQIHRIKWYSGFGIHGWPGKGWLLNVSGLDTVQLTMKNGMKYLIGTDESQKLFDAIVTNLNLRS